MSKLVNLKATELLALAQGAKNLTDIDPVIAEFQRRVVTRTAKRDAAKAAGKSVMAHESILSHLGANLATAEAIKGGLAPAPVATFVADVAKPKRTRKVAQPAGLTADELATLKSFLAKLA